MEAKKVKPWERRIRKRKTANRERKKRTRPPASGRKW